MQPFSQYPDVMIIPEVAEAMRVSASVVEELIEKGEIRSVTIGENKLVLKSNLINYIEKLYHVCYDASNEMHLDNCTEVDTVPYQEETDDMAIKINQAVEINGEKHWITARSTQDFADKVAALVATENKKTSQQNIPHPFEEYAWNWYYTYSEPNIATVTQETYKRQLKKYLCPAFEGLAVEEITPDYIQQMFNKMNVSKATKDKAKMVLNQVLEAALEDKLITANPLKSRKVKITGATSKSTEPYSIEQMQYLIAHLDDVKNAHDRAFLALMALHPLRLEEGVGLKGGDINREEMTITVRRAVTHPDRNQPEIKETKTSASKRTIGLAATALAHIPDTLADEFVFGGEKPLSYTSVRRMCQRIQRDTGFAEKNHPYSISYYGVNRYVRYDQRYQSGNGHRRTCPNVNERKALHQRAPVSACGNRGC